MSLEGKWNSFIAGVGYNMYITQADENHVAGTHEDISQHTPQQPGPDLDIRNGTYRRGRLVFETDKDSFDGLVLLDLGPIGLPIGVIGGKHPHHGKDDGDDAWTATKGGGGGIGDEDSPLRFNERKRKGQEKRTES